MKNGKKRKSAGRTIAMVLVTVLVVTGLMPLPGADPMEAYGAHWADSYLNELASMNIMRGDSKGNMNPDRDITRAEFAAMINRAFGFTDKSGKSFSDVPKTAWYADDMQAAAYQGYLQGTSGGKGNPEGKLTREEAVTMLCRALKIDEEAVDTMQFADSRTFSSWSKGYINAASKKGILAGYQDNTFRPGRNISRGEVAKVLSELAGEIVQTGGQVYLGYVNGNVTLSSSGSGLRNTTISGDLYITEGVKTGFVFLDNVTVLGDVIISGAGESNVSENSIVLTDCNFGNLIINLNHDKTLSLVAQGDSDIENTIVKTNAFLEENNSSGEAFRNVDLKGASGTTLNLSGAFDQVRIMASKNVLNLNKGSIAKLISDEDAPDSKIFLEKNTQTDELYTDGPVNVTGQGKIDYLSVGSNGAVVEQIPDEIVIRPGVTANIGGKDMNHLDAEQENATPRIVSGYPEVNEIEATTAQGVFKGNKTGKVYWVVKEAGADEPGDDEMINPKLDSTILKSGNMALADAEKELSTKLSGLTSGKSYDLYVMLEDTKGDTSRIRYEWFETVDKNKPKFVTGYPRGTAEYNKPNTALGEEEKPGDHRIAFEAAASKDVTVCWAVLPAKSVAPTAEVLADGKAAGAVKSGRMSASMNELVTFYATGLSEATPYDAYLVLDDGKGNLSGVSKLSVTTLDVTPPEFVRPYPSLGKVAEKSVVINHMTNEPATLYWAVYASGADFPPSILVGEGDDVKTDEDGNLIPSQDVEKAKQQAVITGNSAIKNGKTKTSVDKEGNFTVTGLQPQTTYDLWMFIEDASGNRQTVIKKVITTKDDVAPTAAMGFDDARVSDEGYPPVGSDIRIVFSEPVYAGGTGITTVTKLDELPAVKPDADTIALEDFIMLYNTSKEPREQVPIDFTKVQFREDDGYTEIVFTTASDADVAALQLTNGNNYVFELNRNIRDLTGNSLAATAPGQSMVTGGFLRMETFHTMAPFINLRAVGVSDANINYHFIFEMDPKLKGAADNLLYDTVLESDRLISFELYKKEINGDQDAVFTEEDRVSYEGKTEFTLRAGEYAPLQKIVENRLNAGYEKFNSLKKTQYAIKITSLESNSVATSWDGAVTLTLRGAAGVRSGMEALAAAGPNMAFDDFMTPEKAGEISLVSDPGKLVTTKYFEDMVAPEFLSAEVSPGDISAMLTVRTDKPAEIYWMVAPVANVGDYTPTAEDLINNRYKTEGSRWDHFTVESGNSTVRSPIITNLSANTDYVAFYVAKGNRASNVFRAEFTTQGVVKPEFAKGYPAKGGQGEGSAEISVKVINSDAIVFWAVYPVGTWELDDPQRLPTAEQIVGSDTSYAERLTVSGNDYVVMGEQVFITCTGLKAGEYYDFFAVARNPIGEEYTQVAYVDAITAQDLVAPSVLSSTTALTDVSEGVFPKFNGVTTITFSEPLYYVNDRGYWEALERDYLEQELTKLGTAGGFGLRLVTTSSAADAAGDQPITQMVIEFENVVNGTTFVLPHVIGDKINKSGRLNLTFVRRGFATDKLPYDGSGFDAVFK